MDENWPKISVITVVRNAGGTLHRAMDSLRAQNDPNLEYIVLDADSTDGTVDIILHNEDLVTFWRSEADDGPNAAYNEGIERASGDVIAFLNADDWYDPGIFTAVRDAFRKHPELDMVTCEAKVWAEKNGELEEKRHFHGRCLAVSPTATPLPNARFFRKYLFEQYGDFLTRNHLGQRFIASDLEFLLRLSQHSIKNHVLHRVGYHYLMHEGSQTFAKNPGRERQMYDERAWIAETYLDKGTLPAYRSRLMRWHRRGLSRAFFWRLEEGNGKEAMRALKSGLRHYHVFWLIDMVRLAMTGRYKL